LAIQSFFKAKEISRNEKQATLDKLLAVSQSTFSGSPKMEINQSQ
jgi:hypothetical protein